ncbi:hypothetical protein NCPPB940_14190 [Xanthomonas hortorum pv. taraxaci]|nr:hypothetical protein NCPPB940_14190 [Xanthomonas hortorum pv. taraxaci]CAD0317464.1 hypothetical protein NCPPB940_14190 [Xanthomonas hortorum pv. taraxaci]
MAQTCQLHGRIGSSTLEWLTKRSEHSPVSTDGPLNTGMHAWHLPLPKNGRARLSISAVYFQQLFFSRAYPIRSILPIYGRSTSGTSIEPSAFW